MYIEQQLQRVGRRRVLREVKTDASEAPLPSRTPGCCRRIKKAGPLFGTGLRAGWAILGRTSDLLGVN
jgi:hypothetical protein